MTLPPRVPATFVPQARSQRGPAPGATVGPPCRAQAKRRCLLNPEGGAVVAPGGALRWLPLPTTSAGATRGTAPLASHQPLVLFCLNPEGGAVVAPGAALRWLP